MLVALILIVLNVMAYRNFRRNYNREINEEKFYDCREGIFKRYIAYSAVFFLVGNPIMGSIMLKIQSGLQSEVLLLIIVVAVYVVTREIRKKVSKYLF